MSNDDNEIIELRCDKCNGKTSGTYQELFGDLPSSRLLPELKCKCGGRVVLDMTGKYKEVVK